MKKALTLLIILIQTVVFSQETELVTPDDGDIYYEDITSNLNYIITGGQSAILWDVRSGKQLWTIKTDQSGSDLKFINNDSLIVEYGEGSYFKIYTIHGNLFYSSKATVIDYGYPIETSVNKSKNIITCVTASTIYNYNYITKEYQVLKFDSEIRRAKHVDNELHIKIYGEKLKIIDPITLRIKRELNTKWSSYFIYDIPVWSDGKQTIVTVTYQDEYLDSENEWQEFDDQFTIITIWDSETGLEMASTKTPGLFAEDEIMMVIKGNKLYSYNDEIVEIWNLKKNKILKKQLHSFEGVYEAPYIIPKSSKILYSNNEDNETILFDLKNEEVVKAFPGKLQSVSEKYFITDLKELKLWDINTGHKLFSFESNKNNTDVFFSDNESEIIIMEKDSLYHEVIKVWEIKSKTFLSSINDKASRGKYINNVKIRDTDLHATSKTYNSPVNIRLNKVNKVQFINLANGKIFNETELERYITISLDSNDCVNCSRKENSIVKEFSNDYNLKCSERWNKKWDIYNKGGQNVRYIKSTDDSLFFYKDITEEKIYSLSKEYFHKGNRYSYGDIVTSGEHSNYFMTKYDYVPNGYDEFVDYRTIFTFHKIETGEMLYMHERKYTYGFDHPEPHLLPNGQEFIITTEHALEIYKSKTGELVKKINLEGISSIEFSPDSKYAYAIQDEKNTHGIKDSIVFVFKCSNWSYKKVKLNSKVLIAKFSFNSELLLLSTHSKLSIFNANGTYINSHNYTVSDSLSINPFNYNKWSHYDKRNLHTEFSPDDKLILIRRGNSIQFINSLSCEPVEKGFTIPVIVTNRKRYFENKNVIYFNSEILQDTLFVWTLKYGLQNFKLYKYENDPVNFVIHAQDGYYKVNKSITNQLYYKKGLQIINFEQFDLKYNRPDIILDRLGYADSSLVNAYHAAYQKRLKKMGFTEDMLKDDFHLPEIKIENFEEFPAVNDKGSLDLKLKLEDTKYKLDRINVWVNDVAIYGANGISLRDKHIQDYTTTLSVDLAKGKNKVQVSVLNQAGAESYKETFEIECSAGKTTPDLYLITIGVSEFEQTDFNLTYAAKDAQDMGALFQKSKAYKNVFTKTLLNQEVTKENVLALKSFLADAGINDEVMIFFAGHGVLDANLDYYLATFDMDFQQPQNRGLAYDDLENLLDGIKPLKKTLIIDACHSGEIDKEEIELAQVDIKEGQDIQFRAVGNSVKPKLGIQNTSELVKSLFTDLRKGCGATVISSAGGMEFAMEGDDWSNGLFTYCLMKGIKSGDADLNNDGEIWLSEIEQYVAEQVTKLSNGQQQPTSRIENQTVDFRVW